MPVVADDADVVRPPAGSERIWTNSGFYSKNYVVTLWQPIPQFGDVCMGTVAVANDLSTEPDRSTIRCISAQFLLQADGVLAGRNTGWSAVELGFWVSLWTAQHPTGAGISTHAFISRRDLAGPGFNKFFGNRIIVYFIFIYFYFYWLQFSTSPRPSLFRVLYN